MRVLTATAAAIALAVAGLGAPPAAQADHHPAVIPSDFNGDGYADLAVGVPGEDLGDRFPRDDGRVVILYGTADGLTAAGSQSWSQRSPGLPRVPGGDLEDFGSHTTSGDFDADGYADLAVDAPNIGPLGAAVRGAIWLFYGSETGLTAERSALLLPDDLGVDGLEGQGSPLVAGDIDGDGAADLIVAGWVWPADPSKTAGVAVVALPGGPGGVSTLATVLWEIEPGLQGLVALAAGDLDADGADDIAIGLEADMVGDTMAGSVQVVYGLPDAAGGHRYQALSQATPGMAGSAAGPTEEDGFGRSLAIADFDGDGYGDLAIGVPGEDLPGAACGRDTWGLPVRPRGECDHGAVQVVYGSSAGVVADDSRMWTQHRRGVPGMAAAGNAFGRVLAAGDFDGDGVADLVIAAPDETLGHGCTVWGTCAQGSVTVLYGTEDGLSAIGAQRWTQDTPGVPGIAGDADRFGTSLSAADFGRSGRDDLAIGVPTEWVRSGHAGMLDVLYGTPRGLGVAGAQAWSQSTPGIRGTSEPGDQFGRDLAP